MTVGLLFACVAVSSLQLTCASVKQKHQNSQIVYPGPVKGFDSRIQAVNEPDECKDLTYCTVKPHDYPEDRYNEMYKGKYSELMFQPTSLQTDDRYGDPAYMNDCETNISYSRLYNVRAQSGEWRTVIQAPGGNFLQMARLETCREASSPCFTAFRAPPNVKATCTQNYNKWEFLVDDNNGGSEKIHVDLPVCCSCHHKPV